MPLSILLFNDIKDKSKSYPVALLYLSQAPYMVEFLLPSYVNL